MSNLQVQKTTSSRDRSLPLFREFDELMDQIRVRAYDLFRRRGANDGEALDDWLTAEREFCWPAAELEESDKQVIVRIALAGFDAEEIELTASPREIVAKACHEKKTSKGKKDGVQWSEFRSNDVYRHVDLPHDIDVEDIKATLKNGMLEVTAARARESASKARTIGVKAA